MILAFLVLWFLAPVLAPPPGYSAGGADIHGLFIPWLETARQALAEGRLPLWDPHQFGGYAFYGNPQVALFYPLTWPLLVLPLRFALGWQMALHLWLLALGTFHFLQKQEVRPLGTWVGTLSLTFSGFIAARIYAGHTGVIATFTWLPWLLLAIQWLVRKPRWWVAIVGAIPMALTILAGHTSSLLYIGLIAGLYVAYLALRTRSKKLFVLLALLLSTGLALSSIQLIPFMETAWLSSRVATSTFQTATEYSFPPAHLITLFLPDYFGEPTTLGYWSVPLFEELIYYAGVPALLGIALALRRPDRRIWLYFALAILGLWLALGHYSFFYRIAYSLMPLFRLTRAPARAAFLFTFAGTVLAALGLTKWQRQPDTNALRRTLLWLSAVGVLVSIAGLAITGAVFASQHPNATSSRLWHQMSAWSWFLLMVISSVALLWHALAGKSSRRRQLAGFLLVLLVLVDLWHFGQKLVHTGSLEPAGFWYTARELIGNNQGRILPWGLSIFEQNGAGQVGLYSVFGYNVMAPAAAEALTSSVPDPRSTAYDLYNVRYVLAHVPLEQFTGGPDGLELAHQEGGVWLYRRPNTLPPAWLVYEAEQIENAERVIARVHEADFDPRRTALVNRNLSCDLTGSPPTPGTVHVQERSSTFWRLTVETAAPALLVLSENAHPGWQVFIDGEAASGLKAYAALRAVCVPPGEHVVTWQFQPFALWAGTTVSLLAFVLLLIGLFRAVRERNRSTTMNTPDYA
jgi:hypothetical protein